MSKKLITITCVLMVGSMLAAIGVYFAYQFRKERAIAQALAKGTEAYANGAWAEARSQLGIYIGQQKRRIGQDELLEVLLKYSKACAQMTNNRLAALMEAAGGYKEMLRADPENEEFLNLYLDALERRDYWPLIETETENLKEDWPGSARRLNLHAESLDRQGRVEDAIGAYERSRNAGLADAEVYGRLAFLYWESENEEELVKVLEVLRKASASDPGMAAQEIIYYAQKILSMDRGGRDSTQEGVFAEEYSRDALDAFPGDPDVLLAAARGALALRDWAAADEYSAQAIRAAPAESEPFLIRVLALEKLAGSAPDPLELLDEAVEVIDKVDRIAMADSPELHLAKVELLLLLKRVNEASAAREAYKKSYPDHRSYLDYLEGRVFVAEGNFLGGAALLRTVLDARPSFRQAHFYLIEALLRYGRMDEAKVTMEIFLRNYPDDSTIRPLYGQQFGGREALNDAAALARDAQDVEMPIEVYILRAQRLFSQASRLGQSEEYEDLVVSLLEKAIEAGPAEPRAYDELTRVYLTRGKAGAAAEVLLLADNAGISGSELLVARAGQALSDGRTEDAIGVYERKLSVWAAATEPPLVYDLIMWSNMFARAAGVDMGIRVIDLAKEKGLVTGESAITMDVEKISMFARSGDLEHALEILKAVEEAIDKSVGAEAMNAIRYRKEGLIPLLVRQDIRSNFEKAESLVTALIADDPLELRYRVLHARLLMTQDPLPDEAEGYAEDILEDVLRVAPGNVDATMTLSSIARFRGATLPRSREKQAYDDKARRYAQEAAFQNPDNRQAQMLLARVLLEQGQPEVAASTLSSVVELYPDDRDLLIALAEAHRFAGNFLDARAALVKVGEPSELDRGTAERVVLALARIDLDDGRLSDETFDLLRIRQEKNSDDLPITLELAQALALRDDVDGGAVLLEGLASGYAKPAAVWVALARYYARQGSAYLREARAAFTKAIIYEPLQESALSGLIELHMNAGNFDTALNLCETYLQSVYAEDHRVLYRKAGALFALGSAERALDSINQSVGLLDANADYLFLRARIHMAGKDYDSALRDLRAVSNVGTANASLLDLAYAEAHLGRGDVEEADLFLKSAGRRIDVSDARLVAELERIAALREAP